VIFKKALIPGILLKRYKRFLADIRLTDGRKVTAHCPNTGGMLGCSKPESRVFLSQHPPSKRKYPYTWELVRVGKTWVGVNTFLTNRLVEEGIHAGKISALRGYSDVRREAPVMDSRLDFLLSNGANLCYLEVKNVTLGEKNVSYFPDAVTERGTKHLRTLQKLKEKGNRAVICFVVQREDCRMFMPADHIDPIYGKSLREAHQKGVEILVCGTKVSPKEIKINGTLPFRL
jgi:sugar fermentation stimulation protein A